MTIEQRQHRYGPSCWEEMQKPEWAEAREMREAVRQYKNEKHFAECEQWRQENPELARMNAKAKRDAKRRIARLGMKPARRRL